MEDDLIITSLFFGQEHIRIDYIDKEYQSEKGGIESALTVSKEDYELLISDITIALADIIESFLIDVRNPPATLPAGPRLGDRQVKHDK